MILWRVRATSAKRFNCCLHWLYGKRQHVCFDPRRADFPSWVLTPGEIRLWRNELKALKFGSQRSTSRSDMLCPAPNPTLHAEVTQRPVRCRFFRKNGEAGRSWCGRLKMVFRRCSVGSWPETCPLTKGSPCIDGLLVTCQTAVATWSV